MFWEIVCGSIAYLITGVMMWFPEIFGRVAVAISYVIHDISALIMLFGIFFHIYLSTFGEPGTIQAMTRGTVSEAWAWTHHPAWYKAVTGRDPQEAIKEAQRQMEREEKYSLRNGTCFGNTHFTTDSFLVRRLARCVERKQPDRLSPRPLTRIRGSRRFPPDLESDY